MQAEHTYMLSLLGLRNTQFIIPVYQRTYDWKRENCLKLLEDIVRVGKDRSIRAHFLGSIVHINEEEGFQIEKPKQLLIIDGQQRITTVSILFLAMSNYLKKRNDDLYKEVYETYLVNPKIGRSIYDDEFIKLRLTKKDNQAYSKLIREEDLEGIENNISLNYRAMYDFLENFNDIDTVYKGLAKLMTVGISLSRDQDRPQAIFESLNSTGVNLTQADLIRNYVLMDLELEDQKNIYERYWYPIEEDLKPVLSEFIRHYLTLKNRNIPNQSSVYEEFKKTFPKEVVNIESIMKDIYKFSKYYEKIVKQSEQDNYIKGYLINIDRLDVNVVYPLILKLYDDYEQEKLKKNEFLKIMSLLESYILRRIICGFPTHSLKNVFLSIVKQVDENDYVYSVEKILVNKKNQSRFPNDEEFIREFVIKDIYNIKNRKYIFDKLENFNSKEIVNIDSCSIEHIMPQNKSLSSKWRKELGANWREIQSKYLHTIGNLTLTTLNSEMGDKGFKEKRAIGFINSPIRLNQELKEIIEWNEQAIVARANKYANLALQIWTYPDVKEDNSLEDDILSYDENWTGKQPYAFSFLDEKIDARYFIDVYKKVIDLLYRLDSDRFVFIISQEEFRNKRFCADRKDEFDRSYKIVNSNIYLNTNLNAEKIKRNLQLLLDKFDLEEEDLIVYKQQPITI